MTLQESTDAVGSPEIDASLTKLGMTRQEAAINAANGVLAAYTAYNNGSNNQPVLQNYTVLQLIYVFESNPNVFGLGDSSDASTQAVPSEYAGAGAQPALGTPSPGSQLFGFTAIDKAQTHFILALRGTVTAYEAYIDLFGWGNNTPCLLPSQSSTQQTYGQVNSYIYDFYSSAFDIEDYSLAGSCLQAIQNSISAYSSPTLPWLITAHSLGGAIASLLALDAAVSGAFGTATVVAITFGSLHVGDASFAKSYANSGPLSVRIANLCDFVPSMVSLQPVDPKPPYVHVGHSDDVRLADLERLGQPFDVQHLPACRHLSLGRPQNRDAQISGIGDKSGRIRVSLPEQGELLPISPARASASTAPR